MKNKQKKNGSGKGKRLNKGRSGCKETKKTGQGKKLISMLFVSLVLISILFVLAQPGVSIVSPLNQTYTTTTIDFNLTVTDSPDTCWYTLNLGVTNYTMSNDTASNFYYTNSSMSQGSHTSLFYCNDTSNNINDSKSVTFYIDSIPPQTYINASPQFLEAGVDEVTLNWTIGYDLVGVNYLYFNYSSPSGVEIFSSNCVEEYSGACSLSVEFNAGTLSEVGNYTVILWVNDTLGNWVQNSTWFYVNDTTSPALTINSPTQGQMFYVGGSALYVNFSVTTSDLNSIDTMLYSIDGATNVTFNNSVLVRHDDKKQYFTTFCVNDTYNNWNCSTVSYIYSYIASSGGSTGSSTYSIYNPDSMDIFYNDKWVQDTEETITLRVYNKVDVLYIPDTNLNFTIPGVKITKSGVDINNQIIYTVKVAQNAELGIHKILVTAIDDRTISKELIVTISKGEDKEDDSIADLAKKFYDMENFFLLALGGLIIIAIIILIISVSKNNKNEDLKNKFINNRNY